MNEKLKKNLMLYLAGVVLVGGIILATLFCLSQGKIEKNGLGVLSPQEAAQKAIDYINQNMLPEEISASLIEAGKESGVYKVKLKIEEQEFDSFISPDGKLLFIEAIDMDSDIQEGEENQTPQEISKQETPEVELFVMAFCPYGNQAEEIMIPVVDLLGNKANIELHYVIYSDYASGMGAQSKDYCLSEEEKYCSMHGIQELNQGIRELCVQKYQKDKLWNFVKAINENCSAQNVDSCWENIASETGINKETIKNCQKNEGLELLEKEVELNKMYGIGGSPQLIINGGEYNGERNSEGYKTGICSGFNTQPEECNQKLETSVNPEGGC